MQNFHFPLGIAEGPYFCNRKAETLHLVKNIHHGIHTILIAPRRYGKTSLAYRAIHESRLINARVDLFMTTTAADIERAILAGVDHLLWQVSNNAENLLGLIKNFIKSLKPSFEAGSDGLKIKLIASEKKTANICEALQILDGVLKKKSMRGVLLLDEFQEIQRVAPDQGIEGAIRHVLQETKNFTVIFSGSHRHMLKSIFNDRNKPLYRLCDEIQLDRIGEKDYLPFIEKFARKKWEAALNKNAIKMIFDCSECHPYYLNALCEKLFTQKSLPTESDVQEIWNELLVLKRKDVLAETKDFNITHKKLLVAIAHGIDHEFTSQKFLSQSELSGASVIRALEYLENNDFIEKKEGRYSIIDPLLKGVINQLSFF